MYLVLTPYVLDLQTGDVPHLTTSFRRIRNPQRNAPPSYMQPASRSIHRDTHSPTKYGSARRSQSTYSNPAPNGLLQLGVVPDMLYRNQGNVPRSRFEFGLNDSENSSDDEGIRPRNNAGKPNVCE